jgi:hypothetical protein
MTSLRAQTATSVGPNSAAPTLPRSSTPLIHPHSSPNPVRALISLRCSHSIRLSRHPRRQARLAIAQPRLQSTAVQALAALQSADGHDADVVFRRRLRCQAGSENRARHTQITSDHHIRTCAAIHAERAWQGLRPLASRIGVCTGKSCRQFNGRSCEPAQACPLSMQHDATAPSESASLAIHSHLASAIGLQAHSALAVTRFTSTLRISRRLARILQPVRSSEHLQIRSQRVGREYGAEAKNQPWHTRSP